jgi:hypothetical protein
MLKEDLINWVLLQFSGMGATPEELAIERLKLFSDTEYLVNFVSSCSPLENHHFHVAYEA